MGFNIIEGDYEILSKERLSAFEADYLNSELKSNEVRKKYDLSKKQYSEITKEIRAKHGLIRRPYAQSKHYYQQGNRWIIIKTNKSERVYIGSLPCSIFTKTDIENIVKMCKKMFWNIDRCTELIQVLSEGKGNDKILIV